MDTFCLSLLHHQDAIQEAYLIDQINGCVGSDDACVAGLEADPGQLSRRRQDLSPFHSQLVVLVLQLVAKMLPFIHAFFIGHVVHRECFRGLL